MTHIYLIRHADYIYDLVDGKYPKLDQGLSPDGKVQAEKLRERLSRGLIKPDVFISSPERGAYETAQTIAPLFDVPLTPDPDFEEWRSADGNMSSEAFMEKWNALSKVDKPYYHWQEGMESRMEFTLRVHKAMHRVLNEHAGKTLLVVSHGAFIQLTFMYFFGYGEATMDRAVPEIRRTSITHFYRDGDRWILERANDCTHLD